MLNEQMAAVYHQLVGANPDERRTIIHKSQNMDLHRYIIELSLDGDDYILWFTFS
jgi:hypothetical protein